MPAWNLASANGIGTSRRWRWIVASTNCISFKELMQFVLAPIQRQRLLVPIPFALAKFQAGILQLLPKPLLTPDQVELLRGDVTVSDKAKRDGRTLEALGIDPIAMAVIVPSYLWRFRKTGQFKPTAVGGQ